MKKFLWLLLLVSTCGLATGKCETKFTKEQEKILRMAYEVGKPHDLGWSVAAITWQEGFVGKYIVRLNPKDGKEGSYGVTHILLTTAMSVTKEKNVWRAKAEIVPKLMNHDKYAITMSKDILAEAQPRFKDYKKLWAYYNGGDKNYTSPQAVEYSDKIGNKVKYLQQCFNMNPKRGK